MNYHLPKRRKDKYNPYTLTKQDGRYFVSFTDSCNNPQYVEVSKEVFQCFDEAELTELSQMNEYDRHIEHSELTEISLWRRTLTVDITLEDRAEVNLMMDQLRTALTLLSETQRKRWISHHYWGVSYTDIGKAEGCSRQAVAHSVESANIIIKNLIKN